MAAMLPDEERAALSSAIAEIVRAEGGRASAAKVLEISTQALGDALNKSKVGPTMARSVEKYFRTDTRGLLARFGHREDAEPVSSVGEVYPHRELALERGRAASVDPRAIDRVRAMRLRDARDKSVAWWFRVLAQVAEELDEVAEPTRPSLAPPRRQGSSRP